MTRLCLPARIDAVMAARAFTRPRWGNLFGLLGRNRAVSPNPDVSPGALPRIERIWTPAYAIKLAIASRRGPGTVWVSVDGCSGTFALFERAGELAERDVSEYALSPTLDEGTAVAAARRGLLQYILRRRGQGHKPVVETVETILPYHAPVWVLYYRRFRRFIDLAVVDGYTGSPMGARAKQAVLNAIIADHKQRRASTD
ncbi:MAG TPA: hypothetical protein PKL84_03935 [Candidatus Hydrogenedentes bacterium]|nr:hypothetical protein [Candidatus Hydrogenedentota bacterium]